MQRLSDIVSNLRESSISEMGLTPVAGFAIVMKAQACPNRVWAFLFHDPVHPGVHRFEARRATHQVIVVDWNPETSRLASLNCPRKATMHEAETKDSGLIVKNASNSSKDKKAITFGLQRGVPLAVSSS